MSRIQILLFLLIACFLRPENSQAWAIPQHRPEVSVRQCLRCHPLALPTHRRDKVDPSKLPQGWPVAKNGRIVCLTCHDCENGACTLRKQSQQLCMTCHDCSKGMGCMLGKAHLGNSNNIDAVITDCRNCHDGNQAKLIGKFADEHPTDIPYEGTGLNPAPDRKILIIKGKVTCLSCHDPYNSHKYKLSVSDWENVDNLCFECHIAYKNIK